MDNYEVNVCSQYFGQGFNNWVNVEECQNSEDYFDDVCGEVIYQYFKIGFDFIVYLVVEVFNVLVVQWICNYRIEEYWYVCVDDNVYGGDGIDYVVMFVVYQFIIGIIDQQWQEISDYWFDQFCQCFVW